MKKNLFFLLAFFAFDAMAQTPGLQKLWVGTTGAYYMQADANNIMRFETITKWYGNVDQSRSYKLAGDTIRFMESSNSDNKHADFLIDTSTKNKLTLTALNPEAKKFAGYVSYQVPVNQLIFREIHQVYTDTVHFEKMIFEATTCYGGCPAMKFEINNNRQVNFYGGNHAVKLGYYTSSISTVQYRQLIELFSLAELDKIYSNHEHNVDAPDYTLEIHYNHKIKYLYSMWLPLTIRSLLNYLLDLPHNINLKAAQDKFDIKFYDQ